MVLTANSEAKGSEEDNVASISIFYRKKVNELAILCFRTATAKKERFFKQTFIVFSQQLSQGQSAVLQLFLLIGLVVFWDKFCFIE